MKCRQPGCTGTIVDGYCDVCGMPGQVMPTGAGREGARPSSSTSGPCRQPGCSGRIVDGYCDVCGAPPQGSADAPVSTTRARTSVHLGSTAFGSARATSFGARAVRRASTQAHEAGRIGAGLTRVPPAPAIDPAKAVLRDPEVPLNQRVCSRCGAKVGQGAENVASRSEGFCSSCGAGYSFTVKLRAGDLIAGQYEVVGALAHGGMGWIYVAKDRNVSGRWVVLKGLLNAGDSDAMAAAIGEQRFLARVQHPLIVEIYNFVTHGEAGYIVMEYVGGRSLKQLLKQRMQANHGDADPLPVEQSLAFMVEILPALGYLHSLGLLFCDFKPDNVIQVGDSLKLIDLGGVRHVGDDDSPIYGTVGFQAPEVATLGPSVAGDIFTVGRTLMVLSAEVPGYQSTYEFAIPPADELPAFAAQDSLYRLLLKCCATDPNDRFATVEELRQQMLGVLREVVASQRPGVGSASATSALFEAPRVSHGMQYDALPRLRPDANDPQADFLERVASELAPARLAALKSTPDLTKGVLLARGQAAVEVSQLDVVTKCVTQLLDEDPWEWRAVWLAGLGALAAQDYPTAQSSFNAVYGQLPGELAPKLALALSCELGGEYDLAEILYRICASTDAAYVTPAAFGLSRIRSTRDDLDGSLAALAMVPNTSRGYPESLRQRAWELVRAAHDPAGIEAAHNALASAKLEPLVAAEYRAVLLRRSILLVGKGAQISRDGAVLTPGALLDELAATYRELGSLQTDPAARAGYVDLANSLRPWSLV
ncbi:serine/threonine-protein kinase [Propionicimonas sp.]|uniref:serine/threonine-protein kinase n=1 Tax=Propionicimonas sp. TaxID=1955623 RepID=UPI0018251992|nr:serine/threonine-protein kinase [Propionicimonas sp.]MBU3977532.1 protein kinase [Actinomycetota bacterium]MBA3021457.1 protein kinase [Propionicimonas sp.]MBU3986042.1 protein kinase [Actinomycetota bacterium]MBU4008827.1 protein kinase [Actinomycetota bacterium]MBU4066023.1 protein kinase [Actinomycetota bacterium]